MSAVPLSESQVPGQQRCDARLLCELDDALPADALDGLNLKQLKDRCKQLGLKGYSSLNKAELIQRLRAADGAVGGGTARPLPLTKTVPASTPSTAASSELAAVQARLNRLEALLVRIAEHLGVEV